MVILLRYINEYNQDGGYFAGIFENEELARRSVHHIGRDGYEHEWFEILTENGEFGKFTVNEIYE